MNSAGQLGGKIDYGIERDFLIEVEKGNVDGHSIVHKFGRNDGVASGVWEFIGGLSTSASFLTAATPVRIKAGGDVADTSTGLGAQAVTVIGIDDTLAEASTSIETAGASASAITTTSFWRTYRSFVTPGRAGTYGGNNIGSVNIENSGGGTDLIRVVLGEGQSQHGGYTIPTGKTGYLVSALITVDAAKAADVKWMQRANFNNVTTPFEPVLQKKYWDGILGELPYAPRAPQKIAALTDIWFEANGGGVGTEVSVDFDLLLVDD